MTGFLYFVSGGKQTILREQIDAAGISYAIPENPTRVEVTRGPNGGAGVILSDPDRVDMLKCTYHPEQQVWRKVPGKHELEAWVGYYAADKPGPECLLRKQPLAGHNVELGDGNQWLIPIARGVRDQDDQLIYFNNLPQATTLDDDGHWMMGGVVDQHAKLWDIAQRAWDSLSQSKDLDNGESSEDDNNVSFDFVGLNDAALLALSTNYILGKIEVAMLGLFNDTATAEVLLAIVDWPVVKAFLKKKLEAGI